MLKLSEQKEEGIKLSEPNYQNDQNQNIRSKLSYYKVFHRTSISNRIEKKKKKRKQGYL